MTATAYERIIDALRNQDKRVKVGSKEARAQCPSSACPARSISLAIYDRRDQGKAKVVCYAGCSDVLDVLPALGMSVADLYDETGGRSASGLQPDPAIEARIAARKSMTVLQRTADDLLHLPDIGERLALNAARIRPELYIWEREQLAGEAHD